MIDSVPIFTPNMTNEECERYYTILFNRADVDSDGFLTIGQFHEAQFLC